MSDDRVMQEEIMRAFANVRTISEEKDRVIDELRKQLRYALILMEDIEYAADKCVLCGCLSYKHLSFCRLKKFMSDIRKMIFT